MSNSTEAPFSYTDKTAAGNLFTVRGNTYDEFFDNLVAVRDDPELIDVLAAVHGKLHPVNAVSVDQTDSRRSRSTRTRQPEPAQDTGPVIAGDLADAEGGSCEHGVREYRTGTSKAGKLWAGWFCPHKDRNCAPVWG